MRRLIALSALASAFAAQAVSMDVPDPDDGDEYEEVVVRVKKKRRPAAAAVPAVPVPEAGAEKADEPPPPPEPPAKEAADPRRLVRYFCNAWKDKDYERMWWAMSPEYRKKIPLKKFTRLFDSDAEMNGGLLDENVIETEKTRNGNEGVKVELIFRFPKAQHRFATVEAERQPGGAFRLTDSPFIPVDMDDL